MRKFLSFLLVIFVTVGMLCHDADARRFGGGRSFGSRPHYSRPVQNRQAAAPARSFNWGGMITGLLIGGLVASLFMGHGIAAGALSWALVFGIGFLIFSFLRNQRNMQSSFNTEPPTPPPAYNAYQSNNTNISDADFLRAAKVLFIRLQAAYDNKDLEDIRQFTTPEVAAEIQMQFNERGDAYNKTEVMRLDADIIETDVEQTSVRFSGLIKEEDHQPATFAEIWHFYKNSSTQKWIVAGIEQN